MALIMYLTRAPRYKDVTPSDIMLMESYYAWQYENKKRSRYSCETFNEWCGHDESELPSRDIVSYYKQFYTEKEMYVEMIGTKECYSIFEQMARFVKTNHIFNWFVKNVMDGKADNAHHEVTEAQLKTLLETCEDIKNRAITMPKEHEYKIDKRTVKSKLPLMKKEEMGLFFGPDEYDDFYAETVFELIKVIKDILNTTDFENQIIYFNALW